MRAKERERQDELRQQDGIDKPPITIGLFDQRQYEHRVAQVVERADCEVF